MAQGLVHVYYGYGKGKTTAALGLCLRACGSGKKAVIVQFLKDTPSGEIKSLGCLDNVTLLRGKAGAMFVTDMTEEQKEETRRFTTKTSKGTRPRLKRMRPAHPRRGDGRAAIRRWTQGSCGICLKTSRGA